MGRQTSLYPIVWEGDRPWGMAPVSMPIKMPHLQRSDILWRSVNSDSFNSDSLGLWWHFLNQKAAGSYSLTARKGWLRLTPLNERTHILQKETDHYYTAVTKVDLNSTDTSSKAGLYLTNGNQQVVVQLYIGYDAGKKIVFRMDTAVRAIPNIFGNVVWLKLQRMEHTLVAYCSADGVKWVVLGAPINSIALDKAQPDFNSWVGTSLGLFAEGKPADFDFFICKDGFTALPAEGYCNYYGITTIKKGNEKAVTNTSAYGGWLMISGVDLGHDKEAARLEITASSTKDSKIEIFLDNLTDGRKIATVNVLKTGGDNWKTFYTGLTHLSGHHDLFIRFPAGVPGSTFIKSIRFMH